MAEVTAAVPVIGKVPNSYVHDNRDWQARWPGTTVRGFHRAEARGESLL